MKRTQIVATLAFAFLLGAALPIIEFSTSGHVAAAEQELVDSTNANEMSDLSTPDALVNTFTVNSQDDLAELVAALNNPDITKIVLATDINDLEVNINRDSSTVLILDLAGHTITNSGANDILLQHGNLHIASSQAGGAIRATGSRYAIGVLGAATDLGENYSVLTVDADVTFSSAANYGVAIMKVDKDHKVAYGVSVNFNGNITGAYGVYVDGDVKNNTNRPQVTIGSSANITTSGASDGDDTPIYAAGEADWTIGAATLSGTAAIGVKAGTLTFNNTNVDITGPERIVQPASGKIIGTGATFQLEHNPAYPDNIIININGGTYTSQESYVFYEYDQAATTRATTKAADINISGGTFTAGAGKAIFAGTMSDVDVEIRGGTFKGTDVANFVQNGYLVGNLIVDANGTVRPATSGGSSSGTATPTDPATPDTPSFDGDNSNNNVPNTGATSSRGFSSAVNTIVPMLIGAGFFFMFFSGQLHERRRARRFANVETAIDAEVEQIITESEPEEEDEPIIERFVAEPIHREEPETTPVDCFIVDKDGKTTRK